MPIFVVVQYSPSHDVDSAEVFYKTQEAMDRAMEIKSDICAARKMRKTVVLDGFPDDEGNDAWDRMMHTGQITKTMWYMGAFSETNQVCVNEWNGEKFKCACKKFNLEQHLHNKDNK